MGFNVINTDNVFLTTFNTSITVSTELLAEESNIGQQVLTDNDELPADSFDILLAHICTEAQTDDALDKPNQAVETTHEIDDSVNSLDVETEPGLSSVPLLHDNIALNWINLQSYQPPKNYELARLSDDFVNTAQLLSMHDADERRPDQSNSMLSERPTAAVFDGDVTLAAHAQYDTELCSGDTIQQLQSDTRSQTGSKNLLQSVSNTDTEAAAGMMQNTQTTQSDTVLGDLFRVDANTAAQLVPSASEPTSNKSTVSLFDIPQPMDSEQWVDSFSEHIVWFNQQGIKSALIKITPDDLGPLEINIKVVKDMTSVDIVSHSIQAKEILEQALPRLKDMMSVQGLELTEVTIEADSNSQRSSKNTQDRESSIAPAAVQSSSEEDVTPLIRRQSQGLVDYFA